MSAEIFESLYLKCDAKVDWSISGRCPITYGRDGHWPATADVLEVLARFATAKGWQVTLRNEGLDDASADCLCPDHVGGTDG